MSLFQCDNCGCVENTALTSVCTKWRPRIFDWAGIEHLKCKELCCACAPRKYSDGTPTQFGVWHDRFERIYLPKGEWITNAQGNLEHKKTGDLDFKKYKIEGQ